jgi:hypothetical protein
VSRQAGVSGTGSIIQSAWEAVVVSERFIRGAPDELISNIDHDPMLFQDPFRLVEHHHLGEQAQAEMAVLVIVPTKKNTRQKARLSWAQEVSGSNPDAPTKNRSTGRVSGARPFVLS